MFTLYDCLLAHAMPPHSFYKAAAKENMAMVTGNIDRFVENGIVMKGAAEVIECDLVIVATGLTLLPVGGIKLEMDGKEIEVSGSMLYKGFAPDGIPNCVLAVGYLNSSWTLKADLTMHYFFTRLLKYMDEQGMDVFVARSKAEDHVGQRPLLGFKSGYIERAKDKIPMQGKRSPWKLHQSYLNDIWEVKWKRVDDGVMCFESAKKNN